MKIEKCLYERFGDVGLGNPNPEPKPLITFGMVMLPSIFGCEIIYKDDALPWAMPLNLSEDDIMKLEAPDIFNSYPMTEMIQQIEYLKGKCGHVVGDINTTGVQNLALKLRGDQLYFDFYEKPELCRHLMEICTECIIQLFQFDHETTGTGAVDVTPMCDPELYVFPNCTAEQISLETYESHILEYDNRVADACHPVGIHHCGSVDEVKDGYAKVHHLEFIEIGFGSDVKRTREVFGPHVAVNARISPVLMKNGTPEEVAEEVRRLIDNGAPLENFSIDTVGLTYGTPDDNVRTALKTAAEYGKINRDVTTASPRQFFHGSGKVATPVESTVASTAKTVVMGPSRPLVIIDPLAMAVSADDQAGFETLRALRLIRDELGVNQTLGLSNISFGLPERSSINRYLIPDLNIVGEKFEKKEIFVPEMMMAAKSMQACVDLVTPLLEKKA